MPNESEDRSELIRFLLSPSSYPHRPRRVTHVQTHASDVFIVPPFVYKVKKPVDFGFLDFSTLEKRKFYCGREVELNRRLCAGAYLGVAEIKRRGGKLSFGGDGETVEYAVRMKKLPEKKFLKALLREGKVTDEDFGRIARKLVEFYRGQRPSDEVTEYGSPERIRANIDGNQSLSRKFIGKTISPSAWKAIDHYNSLFFREKRRDFILRRDGGFIKDCHGDLHLEHINFGSSGICIYDCIEFNDSFRYIDVASDIAFLAMDLDYNGLYGTSRSFVSDVSSALGDDTAPTVIDFYKCYRAYVRGKVESLRSLEPEVPEEEKRLSAERAGKYFSLALRYAVLGSGPAVIVTFGIIGSGKSTLASTLSRELSCRVISSDRVRKEITGTGETERRREGYAGGIYSEDVTARTYTEIISRGMAEVQARNTVLLDASFSKRRWREALRSEAGRKDCRVVFIRAAAPEPVIRERLLERERQGASVSDAGADILERFTADFEEPDEPRGRDYFKADTNRPEADVLDSVLEDIISAGVKS